MADIDFTPVCTTSNPVRQCPPSHAHRARYPRRRARSPTPSTTTSARLPVPPSCRNAYRAIYKRGSANAYRKLAKHSAQLQMPYTIAISLNAMHAELEPGSPLLARHAPAL